MFLLFGLSLAGEVTRLALALLLRFGLTNYLAEASRSINTLFPLLSRGFFGVI